MAGGQVLGYRGIGVLPYPVGSRLPEARTAFQPNQYPNTSIPQYLEVSS
jgi:hypothetical protein